MSSGVDWIDLNELRTRGVKLGHTPGVLTDAVADLTVLLVLAAARRVVEMMDIARNGEWSTWDTYSNLGGIKWCLQIIACNQFLSINVSF